ncbi:hypothetical protein [Neobacillus vireti]|uniref:Restriction endonuclease n=1 Tax=Neobacillus vireti LMG 21834 TaxID=1131730 RepID=A0AB94IQS6_9BACI|nr:hypothetical protein [Neobacillus vireti]ETI69440.1 hypothetical protein BAVI_07676 [Neobacillus vireti LMG 21834]KLT18909.1 hypothetical protein AA980_06140 [Neobacillus vireti]
MNIFQYQGQEEDHYTNILMCILDYKDQLILPQFIKGLMAYHANDFQFSNQSINIRTKYCPQQSKPYEYIIGIAPYKSGVIHSDLEDNSGSIPDVWICGNNFNLLFEFKIRGTLDEGQISAHKRLFINEDVQVIRLTWDHVMESLEKIKTNDSVLQYLLKNFFEIKNKFKSKRRSSGMPKEIISHINRKNELHFIITGSRAYKPYKVEMVFNEKTELLRNDLIGITAARRYIAEYVYLNKDSLPFTYRGDKTEINDYCVAPGRAEKKNLWNQWRLGSYFNK